MTGKGGGWGVGGGHLFSEVKREGESERDKITITRREGKYWPVEEENT